MLKKVIDISHYDPQIIWDKVKAFGVDGVYIKCTQGTGFADPLCLTHATRAKAQNIKVGYYHFADITADAVAEAKFFNTRLSTLPSSDLLPVLDIETNKGNYSPTQVEAWINSFIDAMKTFGKSIMLYSYTPFLDQYLPVGHRFGSIPLWIAQYRNITSPLLPKGWAHADLWQYTNEATVDGISVKVDMNRPLTDKYEI